MNWKDRDKWTFKTISKFAAYYHMKDELGWELPGEGEVMNYVNERLEVEIQRLREMLIVGDVQFSLEYQEFLEALEPIAWKILLNKVNFKIFPETSKESKA